MNLSVLLTALPRDLVMGNGFMSRPSSADSVSWGRVEAREDKDEDLFQPIRNYSGEIVGWKERCVL